MSSITVFDGKIQLAIIGQIIANTPKIFGPGLFPPETHS